MQPYRSTDVFRLLCNPAGRMDLAVGAWRVGWPVLRRLAAAYRRTALRRTRVAAVIGSFGKSTTTRTVRAVLGFGPDAPEFHNCLSHVAAGLMWLRPGARYGVLEVGITHAGQMGVYARMLRPDLVVVTSIGGEHRTSLPTPETVRTEKSRMVAALPGEGWAILNGDDPNVMWMRGCTAARVMTFGRGEGCDVRATGVTLDWPRGMRVTMRTPAGDAEVRSRFLGEHMAGAVLAAAAVGVSQGVDLPEIVRRIEQVQPPQLRMEITALPGGGVWLVRDEYKSAEETVHAALDALALVPAARKWVVLGPLTEPPKPARPSYRSVGAHLAAVADGVAFLGAGWRDYAAGARRAGMADAQMTRVDSVADAAAWARARVGAGDVVLVKGRNSDRMERMTLALLGRTVRCNLSECRLRIVACDRCPMLGRAFTPHTCLPRCRLGLPPV